MYFLVPRDKKLPQAESRAESYFDDKFHFLTERRKNL